MCTRVLKLLGLLEQVSVGCSCGLRKFAGNPEVFVRDLPKCQVTQLERLPCPLPG